MTIYKYLAMGGVVLALLVGSWFFGYHLGGEAGKAKVATLQASYFAASAKAATAAQQLQQQADANTIAQATAAVAQANQAVTQRAHDLQSAQSAISRLTNEVRHYAQGSPAAIWAATPIPLLVTRSMCISTSSGYSAACGGNTPGISAPAGGTH